jgi:hypothetical protein
VSSFINVGAVVAAASQGSSGIGPVVTVVGLTIGSALVLTWIFQRLPGSNENTGASPFRRRRHKDPFGQPPDDPMDQPPRGSFDR